jgi:hypothetical protein
MAVAVENITERAWQLPERVGESPVRLRSTINGQAEALSASELTRIHLGVAAFGRSMVTGASETDRVLGFEFERTEDPNEVLLRHTSPFGEAVEGRMRIEGSIRAGHEVVLFDARRVSPSQNS